MYVCGVCMCVCVCVCVLCVCTKIILNCQIEKKIPQNKMVKIQFFQKFLKNQYISCILGISNQNVRLQKERNKN